LVTNAVTRYCDLATNQHPCPEKLRISNVEAAANIWARLRRLLSLSPLVDRSASRPNCLSSMGLVYGPARRLASAVGEGRLNIQGEEMRRHPNPNPSVSPSGHIWHLLVTPGNNRRRQFTHLLLRRSCDKEFSP